MLRNASAMIAEREALRMGIEHLTVLFPTEVSSFDFQVECTDRTVQYKLNAQSLRLFGLHRDVTDAHRAGAKRLQNKNNNSWVRISRGILLLLPFSWLTDSLSPFLSSYAATFRLLCRLLLLSGRFFGSARACPRARWLLLT